jgi:hypothetical protein
MLTLYIRFSWTLYAVVSGRDVNGKVERHEHEAVREWCRSNWSSSSHLHRRDHRSMLLVAGRRALVTGLHLLTAVAYVPGPWPFSPFSSSSRRRKLRGILAIFARHSRTYSVDIGCNPGDRAGFVVLSIKYQVMLEGQLERQSARFYTDLL